MIRNVSVRVFGGQPEGATIVIDKDGMRVENKCDRSKYERDDFFLNRFISQCINMDGWQHFWHVDVDKAMRRRSEERKKVRAIMLEKIEVREAQIQKLKDGIQVLGRCR